MELRRGHRSNQAAALPEDWNEVLLDAVAKRGSGHTPDKKHPEYWGGEIRWVSLKDSDALDRLYIDETAATITPAGIANSSAVLHPAGTVVLSRDAGVGKSAITTRAMAVSQHFIAWQCGEQVDNHFLYYWLQSRKAEFERVAAGNTIKTIGLPYFRALKIHLPPVSEQHAIAAALGDVDALLASLDKIIAKKRDLKQAAMQQLLTGQTRLPQFSRPWESRRVADRGQVLAGKALAVNGPGLMRPYLRTKNVLDGRIDLDDVLSMPMTDAEFDRFRVLPGDVLLNEGQSLELVGRCSIYKGEFGSPCAMQNQLLRFRAGPNTCSAYAAHLFRRCQIDGTFSSIATQTTSVAHLGSSRFSSLELRWPTDLKEQEAIAQILDDMDIEVAALEKRREKTRAIKQGMMQELLSGRTRLV